MTNKNVLIKISAGLILLIQATLEWFRVTYIVNFVNPELPFFFKRKYFLELRKKIDASNFVNLITNDPRPLSSILITVLNIGLSLVLVQLLFGVKKMKIAAYCYLAILVVIGLLVTFSFITNNYNNGLDTAEDVKTLIQSPLLSLIFIIIFYTTEQAKSNSIHK